MNAAQNAKMQKITKKIVASSVVTQSTAPPPLGKTSRGPVLSGKTYKIEKSAQFESALYVTLNDLDGTPFEIFLNSKDMKHSQWVTTLTRVISAVFRKGGDCTFLIEELRSVVDPNGGYFRKGRFIPSLVSEIGDVLEQHLTELGLYQRDESLAVAAREMVKEKLEKKGQKCDKCGESSVILMDGCLTCTACGNSKCG